MLQNSAETRLNKFDEELGWTQATKYRLALQFIDSLAEIDCHVPPILDQFEQFLNEQAEEELALGN